MVQRLEQYYTSILDYMRAKYAARLDTDNIFCVGLTDAEFRAFIIRYLLSEDWAVTVHLGQEQINEAAIWEILEKYSHKYRAEKRRERKVEKLINKFLNKIFLEKK